MGGVRGGWQRQNLSPLTSILSHKGRGGDIIRFFPLQFLDFNVNLINNF
jgi:hypothetical protein